MKSVDEIVKGFINYLEASGQEELLPDIIDKLENLLAEQRETAYVTSALPLTNAEKKKIQNYLVKNFGRNLKIDILVDQAVLGGLKIVVGDKVVDQTILGRLNDLSEKLKS